MQMKLVLDNIVFDLQRSGGISVVWYELLKRLHGQPQWDVSYIDNHATSNHYRQLLDIGENQIAGTDSYVPLMRYRQVGIPAREPFLFHSSYYRYCPSSYAVNITTVHDFTYEHFRHGLRRWVHSWQKQNAIRHSDVVICVSENTKRDLLDMMRDVDADRVRVVYNGASEDYHVLEQKVMADELPFSPQSYVVYVGDRSEYKNFPLCVQALKHTSYNLVIVGRTLQEMERAFIQQHLPPSRFRDVGYVTNERLNILYNHAAALVYPSVYEGFGIPVVEAQKAGCPVVAFDGSSIPEVAGSDVLLMKTLTVASLVEKLRLLSDAALMAQVRHDGLARAAQFTWDKMASQYFAIYEEALKSRK